LFFVYCSIVRYFFHVGYKGTNYQGWQKLPQAKSIQQVFETALSQIFKTNIQIIGCGRTDTGVHASQSFFHTDIEANFDFDLKFRLNKNLPADLAVFDIIPVADNAHARFDAFERTYDYYFHSEKHPFLSPLSSLVNLTDIDISQVKVAAELITRYSDFRAFCRHPDKHRTTICQISSVEFIATESRDRARFTIKSNRYLSGMIRIIVERLIRVGKGEMTIIDFQKYLTEKIPPPSLALAPPQGLYLSKVMYPYLDLPTRTDFLMFSGADLAVKTK
jgi:tRNA pseudouridine38-40 synthase